MRHAATLPQALTLSRAARVAVQVFALALAVAVITGTLLHGTAAAATHAAAEAGFVTKMNAERRAAGLGHRANILHDYNQVGVGVTSAGSGKLWVTVVFARADLPGSRHQVGDAVSKSRAAFPTAEIEGPKAPHVTLASASAWPALQSRSLSSTGPILVTPGPSRIDPAPVLHPAVRAEIDRVLRGQGTVYLVGDEAHVSTTAARELTRDGYQVRRLRRAADVTASTPDDVAARVGQILVTS